MQTILEREDINTESNPLHKELYNSLQVFYILSLLTLPKEGANKEEIEKATTANLKLGVATLLNTLDRAGFSIVKNEVPEVFK